MAREPNATDPAVRRLDILISLALDQLTPDGVMPVAGKIRRLSEMGLAASDVARIIGKPLNYVTATLSQQKGTRKR